MSLETSFRAEFATYLVLTLGLTASMTYLSNYTIKRKKNFQEVILEMKRLNTKIDDFNSLFALTEEEKNQLEFTQRELEDCSLQLGRTRLWNRALMFIVSFIANRIIMSKFKFSLELQLPFALPFGIRKLLERGQTDNPLILKMGGIAFLTNESLRKLVQNAIAIKLPKSRMPLNKFAKSLGGENAEEIESMMGWMGM